ncbi:unnamed protein product [Nippostrongylus brasiliensis]|uniref:Uncharacterized protein n=1 Tax=Nippostrongylus brasiliensis TaxID=27835 RepID=A0A0N4YPM7_NIPBR|nr:unnamed protein product [Nippostrongylus brasiliensis]
MRYLGLYSTVYKTTREGQFEALLDDVRIQLDVEIHEDNEQISTRLHEKVCPALIHFARKIANIAKSVAVIEDIARKNDVKAKACPIEHERVASRFDSRGVKLSFKRMSPREKRSALDNSAEHKVPTTEMGSVAVTEEYINEMLFDLTENDNIIFHLHRIPEVQQTYNVHTDFEELKIVANHLEEHLQLHRNRIEDLLSTHLGGEVPLRINSHVHLKPQPAVFGLHRVLIPFNFELDRKLLPPFQFFRTSFI